MEIALDSVRDLLDQVDVLCVPSVQKSKEFHQNLKCLFDLSIHCQPEVELGPLKELYVTNMDSESIWEQVQSRNRPLNRYIELHTKQMHQTPPPTSSKKQTTTKKTAVDEDGLNCEDSDESIGDIEEGQEGNSDYSSDNDSDQDELQDVDHSDDDGDDADSQSEGEEMEDCLDEMDEAEAVRLQV